MYKVAVSLGISLMHRPRRRTDSFVQHGLMKMTYVLYSIGLECHLDAMIAGLKLLPPTRLHSRLLRQAWTSSHPGRKCS